MLWTPGSSLGHIWTTTVEAKQKAHTFLAPPSTLLSIPRWRKKRRTLQQKIEKSTISVCSDLFHIRVWKCLHGGLLLPRPSHQQQSFFSPPSTTHAVPICQTQIPGVVSRFVRGDAALSSGAVGRAEPGVAFADGREAETSGTRSRTHTRDGHVQRRVPLETRRSQADDPLQSAEGQGRTGGSNQRWDVER